MSLPALGSGGASTAPPQVVYETLFSGHLMKAGDDNSRWKKRYFQLITPSPASSGGASTRARLQYFESDRDATRSKAPRGELGIGDVMGLAVFGKSQQPGSASTDAAVSSCISLTNEHVQDGPIKLILWGRDRLWRVSEVSTESNVIGELIRALDRARLIPKVAVRAAGWMRTQGTLNWNRRYALLLSSGDLMLFRDASLEHLRRRIELSKAFDIRPLQPLAPAGSQSEKQVVRTLAYNMAGNAWDLDVNSDAFEMVGIRLRHPEIPEKRGYVMCVEAAGNDDAAGYYGRFRKWIVQLQLSAAEARLSGFASRELSSSHNPTSAETEELLERKLLQIVQSSLHHPQASREGAINVALPYLLRIGQFPSLWRSSLWFVLSGGASLKKNLGQSYSSLIPRDDPTVTNQVERIAACLKRLDNRLVELDNVIELFLSFGGEEHAFWSLASLVASVTASTSTSSSFSLLQGFFHAGFARYVEARVILDLLGLSNPNVVAHVSAYDLTSALLARCTEFMTSCAIPQVWDAVSVWGKDAFSFAAVSLISAKKAEILDCFSSEDLARVVRTAFDDLEVKFSWDQFDPRVVEQVRRAQWSTVGETVRDHSAFIVSWKLVSEESHFLATQTIRQLNRLFPFEQDGNDVDVESIHLLARQLLRAAKLVFNLAEKIELGLEKEMSQTTGGLVRSRSSDNIHANPMQETSSSSSSSAQHLAPLMESLYSYLISIARSTLNVAWKRWVASNVRAHGHCRFVPRASIPPLAKLSLTVVGNAGTTASSSYAVRAHELSPGQSPSLQPVYASIGATISGPMAISASSSTGMSSLQQQQQMSMSQSLEESASDASSLKSLAIGLGKRLFQQRFLPGSGGSDAQQPAVITTTSSNQVAQQNATKPPKTPVLLQEQSATLLAKYRGGFVGLGEYAASTLDATLIRDAQLKDEQLMSDLDQLDLMIRISIQAVKLSRWMIVREPVVPLVDVPSGLKHLFISQPITFDRSTLKPVEESLVWLCQRCMYSNETL